MRISAYPTNYKIYNNPSITSFAARNPVQQVGKYLHIENSGYHPSIKAAMKRLAEYEVEHGIIFTQDGRLLLETIGDKKTPFISSETERVFNICDKFPGHIYIHNHPDLDQLGKPKPITIQDVFVAAMHNASESIVVHPDYTYSSVRCLPNESQFSFEGSRNLNIELATITEQANLERYNLYGQVRDQHWKENAAKIGVIYTNTHDYTQMAA